MIGVFAVVSVVLGAAGALAVARLGGLAGLMDRAGERSSHVGAVPKGAGVGILAAVVAACAGSMLPWYLWVPAAALSLVSFAGDRIEISPRARLAVQFVCAGVSVAAILHVRDVPSLYLVAPLLAVYVVATANFVNFMDGINGIAGIAGLVGFGLLAAKAFLAGQDWLVAAALAPALACLGFLPFNIPKAKVFMGDVGSVLLGFYFAVLAVTFSLDAASFLANAALFFPFYADAATTIAVRFRDGERLSQAHRRHVYQLLANQGGIAHWKVSAGYGLFQLAVGLAAIWAEPYGLAVVAMVVAAALGVFVAVGRRFRAAYEPKGSRA